MQGETCEEVEWREEFGGWDGGMRGGGRGCVCIQYSRPSSRLVKPHEQRVWWWRMSPTLLLLLTHPSLSPLCVVTHPSSSLLYLSLLILPSLSPSLFLFFFFGHGLWCQTDGSQHKHLFGVREASLMTLINKPKGNRFGKYNIFCGYRCPNPLRVPIMLGVHQ